MAKNTGEGYRQGAVKGRTQTENPQTGDWVKRDRADGEFMDVKEDGEPFKGIAKEPDGRRNANSEEDSSSSSPPAAA